MRHVIPTLEVRLTNRNFLRGSRLKKRGRWIAVLVALAASFPALTPAAGTGVGSAKTSASLVSVGVSSNGSNLQSVDVMTGDGKATNDPAANSVHLAEVVLALARADGAIQIDSAPFDVSARAEGPGESSESNTDLSVGLNFGETLNGDVAVASVDASVDASSASASLSQVRSGASILNGLVSLSGVTIVGLSSESTPDAAKSSQTVEVDRAYLFNLKELLDQFGVFLSDLSNGDLAGLAERLLGPNAGDELEASVADLETILSKADQLDAAVGLLEDGAPNPSDIDAMTTIYELANEFGVDPSFCPFPPDPLNPCDAFARALQTAAMVESAISQAKTIAEDAVNEARADLEGDLSTLPLLTLDDLRVSVAAHAESGNSSSSSTVSWGSAEVVGQPVPFADLQEAAQNLGAALGEALSDLGDAFGMQFGLSLSFPSPTDGTSMNEDYETASAAATAFSMAVSATSRSGSQNRVALSLLSMGATADHKVAQDPEEETELTITKTDGVTTVVAGDGVTYSYTVTVTNTGSSDAENVMISDTFPVGFARGALPAGCTDSSPDNDHFTCAIGTIPAGGSASVSIPYTVPSETPAGVYTNVVVIASSHPGDDPSNNEASDTNTITGDVEPDTELAITKTDGVISVFAGDGTTYTYTITVSNLGPSDAEGVMISDTFPAAFIRGALPVGCSDSSPVNDDFTCSLGTIAADTSASVSIPYTVPSGTAPGTYINTVAISSTHPGDDTSDNSASDANTINGDSGGNGNDDGSDDQDDSEVLNDQNSSNNPGSQQNPQVNQPGSPNTTNNQGAPPPGEGTPTSEPTLPKTGADTDRLLLLACQLILLGWALVRSATRRALAEAN